MTNSVSKKRLALFASGRGSNGEALYKAMQEGLINGEFVVIITDHADAGIVERSKGWGIPLIAIERSQFDSKQAFEQAQLDALEPYCVDGIVLAGYMRIVGTVHFVDAGMDTGPIIMQNTVPVYPDDTEDTLSERLLPVEHATYREALRLFCEDALRIEGRIVHYI